MNGYINIEKISVNYFASCTFLCSSVRGLISSTDSEKLVCLVRAACAWASVSLFNNLPQLKTR